MLNLLLGVVFRRIARTYLPMADPRLNSLHLPAPRRQDFRRAREVLLDARGDQTCLLERRQEPGSPSPSGTIVQEEPDASSTCEFWLLDRDHCVYPLHVGLNTLGRSPDNDVVLQDAFTSRRHCHNIVHHRSLLRTPRRRVEERDSFPTASASPVLPSCVREMKSALCDPCRFVPDDPSRRTTAHEEPSTLLNLRPRISDRPRLVSHSQRTILSTASPLFPVFPLPPGPPGV